MRMGELGTGFGAGLKDVRVLFLFPTRRDLDQFVEKGWEMGADAEVAAVAGDKGVDAASQASVSTSGQSAGAGAQAVNRVHTAAAKGVEIYQITEAGLALSITLAGTKYWKDSKLND